MFASLLASFSPSLSPSSPCPTWLCCLPSTFRSIPILFDSSRLHGRMVVFVDYDNPLISDSSLHSYSYIQPGKASLTAESSSLSPHPAGISTDDNHQGIDPSTNQSHDSPNQDAFSAALNCYPYARQPPPSLIHSANTPSIITEIARSIDLNTLHALSRTCRQFHANIAPFGHQLAKQTLRCENEYIETLSDLLDSGFSIPDSVKSILMLLSQRASVNQGRLTRGKVGRCARDMVSECRRCSKVVCRVIIAL